MFRYSILVMTGLGFTWGLLLGLMLHFPAVSSPFYQSAIRNTRSILGTEDIESTHYELRQEQPNLDYQNKLNFNSSKLYDGRNFVGEYNDQTGIQSKDSKDQRIKSSPELINPKEKHITLEERANFQGSRDHSEEVWPLNKLELQNQKPDTLNDREYSNLQDFKNTGNGKGLLKHARITSRQSRPQEFDGSTHNREQSLQSNEIKDTLFNNDKSNMRDMSDKRENGMPSQSELSHQISKHKEKIFANLQSSKSLRDEFGSKMAASPSEHETNNTDLFIPFSNIVQGVYWTPEVENITPQGFNYQDVNRWRKLTQNTKIIALTDGCGRMQNRKVTFFDQSHSCARYRINTDQMQGEIYSYHLGQILGIKNVLPSVLALPDGSKSSWSAVNQEIMTAQWSQEKPVILTPWLDKLEPAFIPYVFRYENRALHPRKDIFTNKSLSEIKELVQWSDLIIFDYLTGNLDRLVNNMFNLQWNSQMMDSPAHNLEKSSPDGLLVFLDNESGLFHGYRLLEKYHKYHEKLLASLCIFKKGTADAIKRLHENKNVAKELGSIFIKEEPLHEVIPKIPAKNLKILQQRIGDVYEQISKCESIYSR